MAVEAKGALPVTILSLGASSYGATRPEFHLLDLHLLLLAAGVFRTPAVTIARQVVKSAGGVASTPAVKEWIKQLDE